MGLGTQWNLSVTGSDVGECVGGGGLEQATCRFACQLASAVEVGGEGTLGFALGPRA